MSTPDLKSMTPRELKKFVFEQRVLSYDSKLSIQDRAEAFLNSLFGKLPYYDLSYAMGFADTLLAEEKIAVADAAIQRSDGLKNPEAVTCPRIFGPSIS